MAITTMGGAADAPPPYPVNISIDYPERLNRFLPLIKWLLAIPHVIILYFLVIAWEIVTLIAFFAILFTTKYPRGMFDFAVGVRRWSLNVNAYTSLMRDEYPPFSWDPGQYPAALDIEYQEELNRWMPLVKWLLAIPHYIVLTFVGLAAVVALIVAFFAILITEKYPRGLFDFVAGTLRWSERVTAYVALMRDEYPPFSLK
jgi:hypothetical protein